MAPGHSACVPDCLTDLLFRFPKTCFSLLVGASDLEPALPEFSGFTTAVVLGILIPPRSYFHLL